MKWKVFLFLSMVLLVSCTKREIKVKSKSEINLEEYPSSTTGLMGENATPNKGGMFFQSIGAPPSSLNALSATDGYGSAVNAYMLEGLLSEDPDTGEHIPALAESWEVSKNGLEFTFKLRENLKFSDGSPVTTEDVKFSYEAILDPKYGATVKKGFLAAFTGVEIIDERTIKFLAKEKFHSNLGVIAGGIVQILPKKHYSNLSDENKVRLNKTTIGSGPYRLIKFDRRKSIILEKNPHWWGWNDPYHRKYYNFDRIYFRFNKDESKAVELVKKGKLDFVGLAQPRVFIEKTKGENWNKKYHRVKTVNSSVKGYSWIGWNNDHPILKDRKVRKALSMMVNRDLMIDKFEYNMSLPANGPIYRQSIYNNPEVKPVPFDTKEALRILQSLGWKDTDGDLILDKKINGKKTKFSITILEPYEPFIKYLTIFKEDAKKIGVEINIKLMEWNSFIKKVYSKEFEAIRMAWGGGSVDWDPNQIWHSKSFENKGSNFIKYSNKKVDSLIEQARRELNKEKRKKMLWEVHRLIAEDYPYTFFFNKKFALYIHTNRMKRIKDTYKYGIGMSTWWISPN